MPIRIKYIIPFPFDEEGIANRAAQIPHDILGPDTVVECIPVRNSITNLDSYYEATLLDAYITEAGLLSEKEGFDAVCMDTVSDSGLYALRSQLSIPVIGPGLVSYCVASMVAKKFSIITMWDKWRHLYEKNLDSYHLWDKCASVRAINEQPNQKDLLSGKPDTVFERLVEEAQKAVDEDGAGAILLGSTTMHEAVAYMQPRLSVPVINPDPVALKVAEMLVQLGLSHSKQDFPQCASPDQDYKYFSLIGADGLTRQV